MSNSRAFRRRLARGPARDLRPAGTVAHLEGRLNAYHCAYGCKGTAVTIDLAQGATPSMLACRATPGCQKAAVSLGYPKAWPAGVPMHPTWEWYRPGDEELGLLRNQNRSAYDHVVGGGLLLRPYLGWGPQHVDPPAEQVTAGPQE